MTFCNSSAFIHTKSILVITVIHLVFLYTLNYIIICLPLNFSFSIKPSSDSRWQIGKYQIESANLFMISSHQNMVFQSAPVLEDRDGKSHCSSVKFKRAMWGSSAPCGQIEDVEMEVMNFLAENWHSRVYLIRISFLHKSVVVSVVRGPLETHKTDVRTLRWRPTRLVSGCEFFPRIIFFTIAHHIMRVPVRCKLLFFFPAAAAAEITETRGRRDTGTLSFFIRHPYDNNILLYYIAV